MACLIFLTVLIFVFLILNLTKKFELIFRVFFFSLHSEEPVVSQQIGKTFVKSDCLDK